MLFLHRHQQLDKKPFKLLKQQEPGTRDLAAEPLCVGRHKLRKSLGDHVS